MKTIPISLIIFGFIIIIFPDILSFLLGGFFIFLWINILLINKVISKNKNWEWENYVKFGNYKIFR